MSAVADRARSASTSAVISPGAAAALQVPPDLLGVRGAGDRSLRHTARAVLAGWRLLRCNPLSHGGYDPVRPDALPPPPAAALTPEPCLFASTVSSR